MKTLMITDRIIIAMETALRTLAAPQAAARPFPKATESTNYMDLNDTRLSTALMRVNHVGEVCAQALYAGQAMMARDPAVRELMLACGREEADHLAWCQTRLEQIKGRVSVLNPIWYLGAFAMGVTAGALGDRRSLSFVVETEAQVRKHLQNHLNRLPVTDHASRAVVLAMQADETAHADHAAAAGGGSVPVIVKRAMQAVSKVMTTVAHRI